MNRDGRKLTKGCARLLGDVEVIESSGGLAQELLEQPLCRRTRPRGVDQRTEPSYLRVGELGSTAPVAQKEAPLVAFQGGEGTSEKEVALPLADVRVGRFSGCGRIAEDSQEIVTELKRLTQGGTDRAQRVEEHVRTAPKGRPDREGLLHGVATGFENGNVTRLLLGDRDVLR